MDPELLRQILENSEPAPQNANPNSTPHAPQATQEGAPTPDEEPGLEVDPEAAQNLMGSIQAGIEEPVREPKVPLPVKSLGLLLVAPVSPVMALRLPKRIGSLMV